MSNRTFASDYFFGKSKELEIINKVSTYFNDNIIHINERYSKWDYKGDKNYYELKSRTNKYSTYPSSMFPLDKIRDDLIILINFVDGLYYIKYEKDIFDKFEIKPFQRKDRLDHKDVEKNFYYIPIEYLSKIE